jgi:glycosyltransferase involved in cell wall biosynthesis
MVSESRSSLVVIRVAFTLIGGKSWTGGYNYLLNLVRALSEHATGRVQPVLFFGNDLDEADVAPFAHVAGAVVIRDAVFDEVRKDARLRQALITGCDQAAAKLFSMHGIDVVFEPAQFYGWKFPLPAVAWIPDFQHRRLKHLFDFKAYWNRELGFRAQILSGRHVMLSSNDAKQDCEHFYPRTRARTHVVRFAVPAENTVDAVAARAVADSYGLPEFFFFLPNQFWVHKNHMCVIQSLQILKARGRQVVVAASGKQMDPRDTGHFPMLEKLIESSGLKDNFRFLGLIPHAHIPALMRSCAALINPSRFEGWSTTVEEAKAMGTPMILSSLRVHREQSQEALFFDENSPEQLANILDDFIPLGSQERALLSESAAELAATKMQIFADEFVKLIELRVKPR